VTISVEIVEQSSPELLDAMNALIPQLSSSATSLTMENLDVIVAAPSVQLFIARRGTDVVGTLTLVLFPLPTGIRAWIEDVVVDEGSRNMGVGEALTTASIDFARTMKVRSIDLTSRPSRVAANELYTKLGFVLRETNVYRRMMKEDELE
jgi:ribosomal protein S18 acetylase RimI-like enzyme